MQINNTTENHHASAHSITQCIHNRQDATAIEGGVSPLNAGSKMELQQLQGIEQKTNFWNTSINHLKDTAHKMIGKLIGFWEGEGNSNSGMREPAEKGINSETREMPKESLISSLSVDIRPRIEQNKITDTERKTVSLQNSIETMAETNQFKKKEPNHKFEKLKKMQKSIMDKLTWRNIKEKEKSIAEQKLIKKLGEEYLLDSYGKTGEFDTLGNPGENETFSSFEKYY